MPPIEALLRDPELRLGLRPDGARRPELTLHRAVTGGDELVTILHVEDLSTRAGSHWLTLRCEVADTAGEAVLSSRRAARHQAAS